MNDLIIFCESKVQKVVELPHVNVVYKLFLSIKKINYILYFEVMEGIFF